MKKVTIKACEIQPYKHALWCSVGDCKEPFWNDYVVKRWYENGEKIRFMLDSFNYDEHSPDELVEVGEHEESELSDYRKAQLALPENSIEAFMKQRPNPQRFLHLDCTAITSATATCVRVEVASR